MIERKPFNELPTQDDRGRTTRCHFSIDGIDSRARTGLGCMCVWTDEEMPPDTGMPLQLHANMEIVIYVREGTLTHKDSLGNEGRVDAGSVQVTSAGTGIRHSEYNLEQTAARIFQFWITPVSPGSAPAWGVQPCLAADHSGCFVAIASGLESDRDALPIRARARVLNAKLKIGQSVQYPLHASRRAYLVPSTGSVYVNGIRVHARDGAAINDVDMITITAIDDADLVMVDVL
jgi:redox-sensitive bicupin YhaK (pirin superfamily)